MYFSLDVKDNDNMKVMLVLEHIDQNPFNNDKNNMDLKRILYDYKWLLVYVIEHKHNFHFIIIFDFQCSLGLLDVGDVKSGMR